MLFCLFISHFRTCQIEILEIDFGWIRKDESEKARTFDRQAMLKKVAVKL